MHLLNMILIGGLSWHAFRQSERIKSLIDQVIGLEVKNKHLQESRNRCGACHEKLRESGLCDNCYDEMTNETSPY